ncbi:hypothetical protein D1298_03140 [Salmonella enterica]|nr:hypothetical protein [Salmonella enterica]EBM5746219.1 hypothetical protein [Salmonella enterica]EDQ7230613.1 hypothetical protein [Salmonella enterica subsp. enterica]EEA9967436.1 hypothetical protein [Salmonella enterica subsp. enterica serovar Agama]EED8424915.1 hypothetical protein [Salmonella enterica subsp. enterica serovar Losangeles]
MAIYIEINKKYENDEVVAYAYSPDDRSWGEFLINKRSLEPQCIVSIEGEKNNFYMFRAWSVVRKEYHHNGFFPERTCYGA